MTKFAIAILYLQILSLTQIAPTQAATNEINCSAPRYPATVEKSVQLRPWLNQVESALREDPKYKKLTALFLSNTQTVEPITCLLKVAKNGQIITSKISQSSGSSSFDHKFLAFLKKASPILPPVNELLDVQEIQIMLFKYKDPLKYEDHAALGCFQNR